MSIHLILGGARSGKSQFAQQQAQALEQPKTPVVYVATASAQDSEMAERIQHHRQHRPAHWPTVETHTQLADTLTQVCVQHPQSPVLVDCLTLWLSNCLIADEQQSGTWAQERAALFSILTNYPQPLLTVSNEVGSGIVPMGELSRRFVDEAGRLHQDLAKIASQVTLVVAGLPLILKGTSV